MKILRLLGSFFVLCAASYGAGEVSVPSAGTAKQEVSYIVHMPTGRWGYGWTLEHFEQLNSELSRLCSQEQPAANAKCLVVPRPEGYAVVWIKSDETHEAVTDATLKKADRLIDSYLFGEDCMRIKEDRSRANQTLVPTATSVTPAADAPVAPAAAAAHL